MRSRRFAGVLVAVAVVLLPAGCRTPSSEAPAGSARSTASPAPSGFGTRFLAVGECSSFGTAGFTEVPCTSERAAARVIARYDGTVADGPLCPATTDFVLHIGAQRAGGGEDGDGTIPQGYACMRSLEPPHPGDPGGGGGPRTIVGDCVYGSGRGEVRETACDGSGRRKPQYRVVRAVASRDACPASTALYVQLGGEHPVGCARRL
ncbi:MAG: hypothetical protein JF597_28295 [Streptomyces sp.]|uniref:hypothetical protein n=1 Tax=Streptomyces sp. TaxID=1931 RepID=UPI0025D5FE1F|nr:hypothetical protein [Streptomyces sp.]MBW8797355.1 hypothetical protein [Streptomyces sp.]